MKILYLTNVPSPYRVEFFNELGKYADLTVLFEKSTSDERDESWKKYIFKNFKGVILKGYSYKTDSAICVDVIKHLKKEKYDIIVCANFSSITGMLAIEYMRLKKIEYYLESDGGFPKNGRGIKEGIKKHYIKGAKGYFSTGYTHDSYYLAYGAEKEKIYRYPFTSLKEDDVLKKIPSEEEKNNLRNELNIKEKNVVLAVGQFIYRKGFDILIKTAQNLLEDTGLYFVGGEPTEEFLKLAKENGEQKIHFVGFKLKKELEKYYKAADVFVLPTREDIWGLVINEAMAKGLPIITTEKCIAGLELVRNGENGYIVPVDDVDEISDKINIVLSGENSNNMGKNSLETIRNYTIEEIVKNHLQVFESSDK